MAKRTGGLARYAQPIWWYFDVGKLAWRAGWHLQRRWFGLLLVVPLGWYLIGLTGSDFPDYQWIWIEAVFGPLIVLTSANGFVGRYERGEMEPYLGRRPARHLAAIVSIPGLLLAVSVASLLSLATVSGDILAAVARSTLAYGILHLSLNASRSRWFGIMCFLIWWLFGLSYMTAWAEAATYVATWHPMRLSGGGMPNPSFEWVSLANGLSLCFAAWVVVGRDSRWI